jgi:hypothetical protein
LGIHAPKIYLCGLLNLTASQRTLLHGRNVVPVDFWPQFEGARYQGLDTGILHRYATEWFLRSLAVRPTYNPLDWPSPPPEPKPFPHLPDLLPVQTARLPKMERMMPG